MPQALRKLVRVQPGGRIELQDDALPEGTDAEVIILLPETAGDGAPPDTPPAPPSLDDLPAAAELDEPPPLPLTEIIGSGKGLFETPEEVDAYIRALRDEWD